MLPSGSHPEPGQRGGGVRGDSRLSTTVWGPQGNAVKEGHLSLSHPLLLPHPSRGHTRGTEISPRRPRVSLARPAKLATLCGRGCSSDVRLPRRRARPGEPPEPLTVVPLRRSLPGRCLCSAPSLRLFLPSRSAPVAPRPSLPRVSHSTSCAPSPSLSPFLIGGLTPTQLPRLKPGSCWNLRLHSQVLSEHPVDSMNTSLDGLSNNSFPPNKNSGQHY